MGPPLEPRLCSERSRDDLPDFDDKESSKPEQHSLRFQPGRARNCQSIERNLVLIFLKPALNLKVGLVIDLYPWTACSCRLPLIRPLLLKREVNHAFNHYAIIEFEGDGNFSPALTTDHRSSRAPH